MGAEEPAGLGVWAALVFLALRRRRLP
ncbi:MAG: hypothetical protein DYH12_18455 [Sorangiineae bacterium PRO1]|nr:hypothetical protein [Sorangiineae bacterium PRO1]